MLRACRGGRVSSKITASDHGTQHRETIFFVPRPRRIAIAHADVYTGRQVSCPLADAAASRANSFSVPHNSVGARPAGAALLASIAGEKME